MLDHALAISQRADCRIRGGRGTLERLGDWMAELLPPPRKVALLSDRNVASFWLKPAEAVLKRAGFTTHTILIPPGEESKSQKILGNVWDRVLTFGIDRDSALVAVGGGVVGDLAGFAAATLLRGIALVQVPTSLVAQVDSAIGGKTGLNRPLGKNLVGAFHQPRLVVIDPDLLATLPERELRSGLAEVIKYGYLLAPELLAQLRAVGDLESLRNHPEVIDQLVVRCATLKAELVQKDERETGQRALLNFGHTVGHALEAADGYRNLLHGEAVAIGMVAASFLAVDLGVAPATLPAELSELLERFGLPHATSLAPATVLPYLGHDKKRRGGKSHWVLVGSAGAAGLHEDPPAASIERALAAIHVAEKSSEATPTTA